MDKFLFLVGIALCYHTLPVFCAPDPRKYSSDENDKIITDALEFVSTNYEDQLVIRKKDDFKGKEVTVKDNIDQYLAKKEEIEIVDTVDEDKLVIKKKNDSIVKIVPIDDNIDEYLAIEKKDKVVNTHDEDDGIVKKGDSEGKAIVQNNIDVYVVKKKNDKGKAPIVPVDDDDDGNDEIPRKFATVAVPSSGLLSAGSNSSAAAAGAIDFPEISDDEEKLPSDIDEVSKEAIRNIRRMEKYEDMLRNGDDPATQELVSYYRNKTYIIPGDRELAERLQKEEDDVAQNQPRGPKELTIEEKLFMLKVARGDA